jgi:hypothetical protein
MNTERRRHLEAESGVNPRALSVVRNPGNGALLRNVIPRLLISDIRAAMLLV